MSGLKWWTVILLLFSFPATGADSVVTRCPAVVPESNPFWKKKEKVVRKMREDRYIPVSVKTRKPLLVPAKKEELYLLGAAFVKSPVEFSYVQAQRFEDFPKMSSLIKSSKWDPGRQHLDMVMEAFKYRARMKMKIDMPPSEGSRRDIRFCVIEGAFLDMGGVVRLEPLGERETQISLTALQGFDKLPMPKFFLEFGMEMAMQIAAGKMRSFVEEAYEKAGSEKAK